MYAVNKTRLLGGVFDAIFYFLTYFPYKIDDVFLEYQKKNDIKSGDISPEQALRLDELQNELADLVMHVGSRQEEHS